MYFSAHNWLIPIYRNETELTFIPVPSYASSFTRIDDDYRSVSLPSPFEFGNSLYSTAYVKMIEKKLLLLMQIESCFYQYRSAPMDLLVLGVHTPHSPQAHSQLHSESLLHTGMIMTSAAKALSDIFLLHQHIQRLQVSLMMLVTL